MQTNLALSAIHVLVVLAAFMTGCFLIGISVSEHLRLYIAEILLYRSEVITSVGVIFLLTGLFLFLGFYVLYRHRVLRYKMQPHLAEVNAALIQNSLENYWKTKFPEMKIQTQIAFRSTGKLEISILVPSMGEDEQIKFLEKSEKDIGDLLYKMLGYDKEFFLTLSFH